MNTNMGLALLGIVVTVFFGVLGVRAARKRLIKQEQNVSNRSTAIQSGRDTDIGEKK
jgi:hypothetical protein